MQRKSALFATTILVAYSNAINQVQANLLAQLQETTCDQECQDTFKHFDKNTDGTIDADEFACLFDELLSWEDEQGGDGEDGDENDGDEADGNEQEDGDDGDEQNDGDGEQGDDENEEDYAEVCMECDCRFKDDSGELIDCATMPDSAQKEECEWEIEFYEDYCVDGGDGSPDGEGDDGEADDGEGDDGEADDGEGNDGEVCMECDCRFKDDSGELIDCATMPDAAQKEECEWEIEYYQDYCVDEGGDGEGQESGEEEEMEGECDMRMKDESGELIDCATLENADQKEICELEVDFYENFCVEQDDEGGDETTGGDDEGGNE